MRALNLGKVSPLHSYDARAEAMNSATSEVLERRAWDLNPRDFRLPVFKTGALGRYASPPWGNLPVGFWVIKIQSLDRWLHVELEANREHVDRDNRDHSDHNGQISIEIERVEDDEE